MNADANRLVTLDEVVSLEVPVRWDEAVAAVEQLCALLVSSAPESPVPALEDVTIGADGTMSARHLGRGEGGAVEVGRTLHTLLSTADVPVALRLFVTQATNQGTHASIREFAAALSYFGKPTRSELVRALHDRCVAARGGLAVPDPTPLPFVRAGRDGQAPRVPEDRAVKRRRPRWVVPAGVAVGLLGVAAGLWFSGVASRLSEEPFSGLLSRTTAALAGLGTDVRDPSAVESPASELPVAVAEPTPVPRATAGVRPPSAAIRAASDTLAPTTPPVDPEPSAPATLPVPQAPLTLQAAADEPTEPAVAPIIYSIDDPDVSPPVFRFPSWTAPLMFDSGTGPLNRMEIVVSAAGNVERVRLVDGPTRLPDMMLLSVAKSWRFRPALKDGTPVRYRTVASWEGFP